MKETGQIMDILKTAYPKYYFETKGEKTEKAVALWAEMFKDDSFSVVAAAVKSLIASDTKGFPPVIGQVKEKIRLLTQVQAESEMEAWKKVLKAVRVSTYDAEVEFMKFPPIIKRIVGSPSTLREWAKMDSEKLHTVVASNFQRSYKTIAAREKEVNDLPPDIRSIVQKIGQNMGGELEEKKEPARIGPGGHQEAQEEKYSPAWYEGSTPIPESVREALRTAFSLSVAKQIAAEEANRAEKKEKARSKEDVLKYLKGE